MQLSPEKKLCALYFAHPSISPLCVHFLLLESKHTNQWYT